MVVIIKDKLKIIKQMDMGNILIIVSNINIKGNGKTTCLMASAKHNTQMAADI